MTDVGPIIDLFMAHQWIPGAAAVIFLLMRLLKSPRMVWPLSLIPPKARTLVVVVLGFAGAGLQSVAAGVPWQKAVAENVVAALIAILAHDTVVEWLRKGRELGTPKPDARETKTLPPQRE
jgi:hypothetical protein